MKKAALSTSQSFQHRASAPRAFALTPSVDKALTSAASSSTTLVRSTVAVSAPAPSAISPKPEPPQLNWPRKQVSPPMTADPDKDLTDISLVDAVAGNNIDAVKALIKADVDLRPANWYDTPVLVTAAAQGYAEIVQLLVSARANVNNGYESLPLGSAAERGHLGIVRLLLSAGAYLNAEDVNGRTALMAAAAAGQLAVVRFLVEKGALVTSTDADETALSLAAKGGHQAVYAFLHQKITPVVAPQPPVVPQQRPMSVMAELIDSGAKALSELLSAAESDAALDADSE